MKTTTYALLILLIAGCGQSSNAPEEEKPRPKRVSRYQSLLSKYPVKDFDTLSVYSPASLTGEYAGRPLDSAEAAFFPADIARQHFDDTPGLFAVYQFALDSNTTGLITRTPSMYVPSSIKLFFFDRTRDTITSYIELAELWGDAGDVSIKDSWIFKEGQSYASLIMVREMHHNSVEHEADTTIERQDYYYLLRLSKRSDTMSTDQVALRTRFRHLVDKAPGGFHKD